jgi:choline dehydrogenase-like flavoprotein
VTDVIVVGSGPGGANAAARLVEAGRRVLMLDYGNRDERYAPLIPDRPFSELRRTDDAQYRYFLGDRFEGVPFGAVKVGAQLTPPRMHVLADAAERIPVEAENFAVSMSLARGGLGAAWSAGVFPFTDDELAAMALSVRELAPHYDAVAERIGVCGERDDLETFFPSSAGMLPPLEVDTSAEIVLERYARRRDALNREGFFLGRARLAVCTAAHRGRGPHAYFDLCYWADKQRSVYRPQWTLDELEGQPNFTYLSRRLVERFVEQDGTVHVVARDADTGREETHEAPALVLAAGTLGTAWLVLRSLGRYDVPVPLLCNPYTYVPTLNTAMLRRRARDRRYSLAQLTAVLRVPGGGGRIVQAQLFSYRSLLTFKLMKETPLACRDALRILRAIVPDFAILGIHHEDRPGAGKTCILRRAASGAPDRLEIRYHQTDEEVRRVDADEALLLRAFRRLGCWALRKVRPGHGASLHYAGTFPMATEERELTCDRDSRLRGTRAVYLADGSIFPWIPPKGLTFNLMANADRVGALLARRLA